MEMFYTVQGEGFYTGTAAFFIRLAGCDVGCVWCDEKASWDVAPEQYHSIDSIVSAAMEHTCRTVVITGGEPCMYNLTELIDMLHSNGFRVHMETSGAYPLTGNPEWV